MLSFEAGHKILYTRQTMTSAHLSIIPEFSEKVELLNAIDKFTINKTEIINKQSGSEILFRGLQTSSGDNTASLKSLNGVTHWCCDEAEELVSESTFDKINLSVRQKGKQNRVILILNPSTMDHWIFKRFFEDAGVSPGFNGVKGNVTYIHTDYRDNEKHLDQSFLDEIERVRLTNPKKYQHQILGGWRDLAEGAIFTNWREGEFDTNLPYCYAADFGFKIDPDTLVKVAVNHRTMKVYVHECYYERKQLSTDELAQMYKSRIERSQDLIVADNAEPRLIADIKKKNLNIIECEKGQGSVVAGITALLDYEIIVTPESINVKKELRNYVWNDKKAGIPVDDWNHAIDPLRYAFKQLGQRKSNASLLSSFR